MSSVAPASVVGSMNYQSEKIHSSLRARPATGEYPTPYVNRTIEGNDPEPVGLDTTPTKVDVHNGRLLDMKLDINGFEMVNHKYDHIDYYDESEIINKYYAECSRLVQQKTGAKKVYCFDHNIRSSAKPSWMNQDGKGEVKVIKGGNEVQTPAAIVHNDYTLTSAPKRLINLSEPSRENDTLKKVLGVNPLISQEELKDMEGKRYVFINVWRNISEEPVYDMPLALCDAQSFSNDDLITFELRYKDRVGENYFAKHTDKHKWVYFPQIEKDEAILLKVWDSYGAITAVEGKAHSAPTKADLVPASFSFHTAFKDETVGPDAPKRESIECRLIAVF